MSNSTLYGQLMSYLRQHSRYCDLRHLKALGWMVSALICRAVEFGSMGTYVPTRAQSPKHRAAVAEIHEQRPDSSRSPVSAVSDGGFERVATKRVYLALDTTVLWDRYCMIHLSVVCCGRAVPCCGECWSTIATVAFGEYQGILRKRAGYRAVTRM